jgi:alpha-L-arabinofuranosidase
VDYLDVCVTRASGRLAVGVVNRHQDRALPARFEIAGAKFGRAGKVYTINGSSPDSHNTLERPKEVMLSSRDYAEFGSPGFVFEFPPHSVTLLELSL